MFNTESDLLIFSQGYEYVDGQNPADYLVKSLAQVAVSPEGADKLCSAFETTEYHTKMMKYIQYENKNEHDPVRM